MEKVFLSLARKIAKCIVFISYSSKNLKVAEEISELVERYGGIPFIAPYSIEGGENSKKVIFSNISNCDIFLPLIDSDTTQSTFVHQEIVYALKSEKNIIPVKIGEIKKEDFGFLSDLQYEDYDSNKFKKLLRKKILKRYASKIWLYTVILIILLWMNFSK